jgi:hypothetical protein
VKTGRFSFGICPAAYRPVLIGSLSPQYGVAL